MPKIREFKLPDVGEGLPDGDIVKWLVAVGDEVILNQPVVEVETAKVTVELPTPFAGVVTKLFYEVGTTVEVGAPILAVDIDPHGAATDDQIESEAEMLVGPGPKKAATTRRARKTAASRSFRATQDAARPSVQETFASGAERVAIAPGSDDGYRPALDAGGTGKAGTPSDPSSSTGAGSATGIEDLPEELRPRIEQTASMDRMRAKPPVRRYARDRGIDLATCIPSGPDETVTRDDVDAAAEAQHDEQSQARTVAPAASNGPHQVDQREERIPIRGVRRATAAAMVSSAFTAPHVTEFLTVDVTRMMKLRRQLTASARFADVKLSPLSFVARAVVLALGKYPMVGSTWDEQAQEVIIHHYVNLGIAAATPRGLLVPNIPDAQTKSIIDLAAEIQSVASTARAGKLSAAQLTGGTFTISNVGVFGVDTGTPIINPGESAILAFGQIRTMPWVHKGKVKPREVTTLGLSFDHRVIDGELGSRFLATVGELLADPSRAFTL